MKLTNSRHCNKWYIILKYLLLSHICNYEIEKNIRVYLIQLQNTKKPKAKGSELSYLVSTSTILFMAHVLYVDSFTYDRLT